MGLVLFALPILLAALVTGFPLLLLLPGFILGVWLGTMC
jgi:hypothetical protein